MELFKSGNVLIPLGKTGDLLVPLARSREKMVEMVRSGNVLTQLGRIGDLRQKVLLKNHLLEGLDGIVEEREQMDCG